MKLTRGEFCQFNLSTRFQLLQEFGKNIFEKKIRMRLISVYRISDFYVEVYENLVSHHVEKVEPVKTIRMLDVYRKL
jgi:hypothetical protein